MKAIFIVYDQAYNREIIDFLDDIYVRGYTMWENIYGRGSVNGEPHEGSHAWPVMNNALLVFVAEEKVAPILEEIKKKDEATPALGLRAFVWNIEQQY